MDGRPRMRSVRELDRVGELQVDSRFVHQRPHQVVWESRDHDGGLGDNFAYDSLNRVVDVERMTPDVGMPDQGNEAQLFEWELDGANNWGEYAVDGVAAVPTLEPSGMNEYASFGGEAMAYDANGNMTSSGNWALVYDAFNRLISMDVTVGNVVVVSRTFAYDALGRRTRIDQAGDTSEPPAIRFVYDGWNVLEERDANGAILRRYVQGISIDEPIRMEVSANLPQVTTPGTYYTHASRIGSIDALSNAGGALVERYEYSPYGEPVFLDATGAVKASSKSDFGNPFLFAGMRYEACGRGLYYVRNRYYRSDQGRFISRDPIGLWGDSGNLGNGYTYGWNNPVGVVDPHGLQGLVTGTSRVLWVAKWGWRGARGATPLGWATIAGEIACVGAYRYFKGPDPKHEYDKKRKREERYKGRKYDYPENPPYLSDSNHEDWRDEDEDENEDRDVEDIDADQPPFEGKPGSTKRARKKSRRYGEDGYPEVDRDLPHPGDNNPTGKVDHAHDWGRPEGGGPPTDSDRGSPRRPTAGDPPPPIGYPSSGGN